MLESTPATVFVETYGCQMNVLDSELIQGQLEGLGYRFVECSEQARVVLINTCSVRELSEQKVWSQLGRLAILKREERPDLIVGVIGCMAEKEGRRILRRMPHVDLVCGPSHLDRLPQLIENALTQAALPVPRRGRGPGAQVVLAGHNQRRAQETEAAFDGVQALDLSRVVSGAQRAQAYVRITRGCNKFCSFCVVPYTRGPEVHRSPGSIIDEVRRLVDAGVLEVTLIGQTVNHYAHHEAGQRTSFADLLWQVHEGVPELSRLRFLTSYPRDFPDEALEVMAAAPRICRYLHIPGQSGSNRLLRLMNRGHTVEAYCDLIDRARALMPDIRLAGDIIVGFPTETAEDHQASIDLVRRARYKSCFVFKYSARPGTVAGRRYDDDVPEQTKKDRNNEILAVQGEVSLEQNRQRIGEVLEVLVEARSKLMKDQKAGEVRLGWNKRDPPSWVRLTARTRGDEIVAFDGPASLLGTITTVRATDATPLTILAEWEK